MHGFAFNYEDSESLSSHFGENLVMNLQFRGSIASKGGLTRNFAKQTQVVQFGAVAQYPADNPQEVNGIGNIDPRTWDWVCKESKGKAKIAEENIRSFLHKAKGWVCSMDVYSKDEMLIMPHGDILSIKQIPFDIHIFVAEHERKARIIQALQELEGFKDGVYEFRGLKYQVMIGPRVEDSRLAKL